MAEYRGVTFSRRGVRVGADDRSAGVSWRELLTLKADHARFRYVHWGDWYDKDAFTVAVQQRGGRLEYALQGKGKTFLPVDSLAPVEAICSNFRPLS